MSLPQSPAQQGPSVQGFTPFLIAVTICSPLWGVTIAQAAAYYRTYQKDNRFLKSLVGACVILNTAQLATLVYTVYFWVIVCRVPANYQFLGILDNALVVVPAYITYFLTTVVQCFYAMRVWFISEKNLWLVIAIVTLSVTQLVGGFALVSYMTTVNQITAVYSNFNHVSGSIELGSSMACDILISASLWWYLRKSRTRVFTRTRNALDELILQAVNIGLLTNVVALANLVTWLAAPESDFTWAVFHFSLGKVYVNSMLVSLNAREKIRHNMSGGKGGPLVATSTFNIDETTRHGQSDFELGVKRSKAVEGAQ